MSERPTLPNGPRNRNPRDAGFWAAGRNVLRVGDVPEGAVNLNIEGRQVIGQLWRKTYTLRLEGAEVSPEEVVAQARIVSGLLRRRT